MSPGADPLPSAPGSRAAPVRPLVLVGMPGAGKSTLGRALAQRRGWAFVDLDDAVEADAGMGIPELWRGEGEAGFRRREAAALVAALSTEGGVVVATGGGVVVAEENRSRLGAGATVVWLRARLDTLAGRVGSGDGRPLLAGDDPDGAGVALAELARTRTPRYEEVADVVIDVDGWAVEELVDRLDATLASASG